MINLVLNFIGH